MESPSPAGNVAPQEKVEKAVQCDHVAPSTNNNEGKQDSSAAPSTNKNEGKQDSSSALHASSNQEEQDGASDQNREREGNDVCHDNNDKEQEIHSTQNQNQEREENIIICDAIAVDTNNDEEEKEISNLMNKDPTVKKGRGGWAAALIMLANQGLATLAFFGVGVNLVLFLTRVLGQGNADAANNVSKWTGTVYIFSLVGAFLSDSYWGRFKTCAVFQLILVVGLGLLSFSSWHLLIKPSRCGDGWKACQPASTAGEAVFYLAIYLVALGYGGHQPTLATLGADQFDEKEANSKAAFFCYFYFALNVGSLFSNTVLVYIEDEGHWTIGFLVSLASAVIGLLSFIFMASWYRFVKPYGNPLPRVAQVFVASFRKWDVVPAKSDDLYEVEGPNSAIKGSRKIVHSDDYGFLDKAATVTEKDTSEQAPRPWRLCTVTQVEEAKCVLKMLPIWLCTIIYSVIFTQMASLFVEQGDVMNSQLGNFHLPAASMSAFDICSVLICTGIYQHMLVPLAGRLSGKPKGLTELQRMGIGLIIGLLAMVAAGVTEVVRRRYVTPGVKVSSMSIFWQVPQYALVGASEVFMYVGQLEFFNGQAPDGIKSFGSSLCMASISLGNYVSSMLVAMVMAITTRGDKPGWIPADLNTGQMDKFFFLIAVLAGIDFLIYMYFAKRYNSINIEEEEGTKQQQREGDDALSRV